MAAHGREGAAAERRVARERPGGDVNAVSVEHHQRCPVRNRLHFVINGGFDAGPGPPARSKSWAYATSAVEGNASTSPVS